MFDTAAEVDARQAAIHRRMSPVERLRAAVEASLLARGLLLARLRADHPGWCERELLRELLRLSAMPQPLPAGLPPREPDGGAAGSA